MICTTYFLTFFSELIPPTGIYLCFNPQIYSIIFIFVKLKRQKIEYHGFSIKSIS